MEEKRFTPREIRKQLKQYAGSIDKNAYEDFMKSWYNFSSVSRFKSVRRAIRRGKIDFTTGNILPARPYNNRKPTRGRFINELKKKDYDRQLSKLI